MNVNQNYLALDLEMNQPTGKIIQIGIAIGTYDDYVKDTIKTAVMYIDPKEEITEYITELTGITNQDIKKHGKTLEQSAEWLSEIITQYDPFINPVTWGSGDLAALKEEYKANNIQFKHMGRRVIDIKTYYVMYNMAIGKTHSGGLSSAMSKFSGNSLKFKGNAHSADVDAHNTLRFFFYMMDKINKTNTYIKQVSTL